MAAKKPGGKSVSKSKGNKPVFAGAPFMKGGKGKGKKGC